MLAKLTLVFLAISCVLLSIVIIRHTNQLLDIERRLRQLEQQSKLIPKNSNDGALPRDLAVTHKRVMVSANDEGYIIETFERPDGCRYTVEHLRDS